jgi:UPF0716 protein FxsA
VGSEVSCFCRPETADFCFAIVGSALVWLLVFFLTPIAEMYLLIEVGGYIGVWPTIALVMITAVIGVTLLRIQGLATLTRGIGRLNRGELPAQEMVEGLLLAVAGALLLTPGFVTDLVGFVLLAPSGRALIAERVLANVQIMSPGGFHGPGPGPGPGPGSGSGPRPGPGRAPGPEAASGAPRQPEVIEGEFAPLDPSKSPPDSPNRP